MLFTEITRLAERVNEGLNDFESDLKIMSYLQKATFNSYKRSLTKDNSIQESYSGYFRENCNNVEPDVESEEDNLKQTKNLYDEILTFLDNYESYSDKWFMETGIFKSYYFNNYTFDKVSETTGYSRAKCFKIVKQVGKDLEVYLRKKGYMLSIKKRNKRSE